MPEEEKIQVEAEQVLSVFQQLYPTEFAHVMATVEAQYWKQQAQAVDETE